MKFSKLLVLSALWLGMASNAKAAVPDGVWSKPEPTGLEFTTFTNDTERYILYNTATNMFFASGNGWNTMASLRTFGMEMWLDAATEADAPEGSYRLCDNNVNNPARTTGEGDLFTDDGDASWVDHGSQPNFSWGYTIVGDCVRFQNVALIADKPEFEGKFIGFDGTYVVANNTASDGNHRDAYTAILRHVDPAAGGADWKAVTVASYEAFRNSDSYEAYAEGMKQYIAAMGLKKAIEDAEGIWIDVTSALAIYTNTSSSADNMSTETNRLNDLIGAKQKLQKAIEEAKAKGFDGTAPYEAVLKKLDATKAEVEQAITDLNNAVIEWGKTQASWNNPVDMSTKIVNPTFDNGNLSGWSGDAFGRGGTVADGAEHYSKNYDTYQKITGLVPGVYSIGVNGFYRAGNYGGDAENHWLANDEASKYAKLYGKAGANYYEAPIANVMSGAQTDNPGGMEVTYTDPNTEEQVTVYVPNTMAQGDVYFHELGQYANKVFVAVSENDTLTIGVKKTTQIGGDWSLFDDFSLSFYGAGADACQGFINEAMKNFSEYKIEAGTLYTAAYLTAYQQAYEGEKTAATMAEVNAILNAITKAKEDLDNNIKLWKKYVAKAEDAKTNYVTNPEYDGIPEVEDLADYLDFDYEDILKVIALTNEELEAEIAKMQAWMDAIIAKSKLDVYDGKNMTTYITNPGFDDDEDINYGGAEGWTIDRISGGNVVRGPLGQGNQDIMVSALGEQNFCFESWHCHKWDIWQEIKDLPKGMYELQVQGYIRCEVGGYTQGDPIEPDFPSPVKLYMNKAESQFPSVYDEQIADEHYVDGALPVVESHSWNGAVANYPNSMGAASLCFKWGMYQVKTYGLIANEGDVFRIGVKMDKDQDWWCIFDNFKLTYRTPTVELVKPLLEEQIAKAEGYEGQAMTKTAKAKLDAALNTAKGVLNGEDGQAMFDALGGLYDITSEVEEAIALCEPLQKAVEKLLEDATGTYASSQFASAAQTLGLNYQGKLMGCELEAEEIEPALIEVKAMSTKIRLPEGYENASDEAPVEISTVIMSPSFYDEDLWENTSEGWTNPGNLGNDDEQKGAGAMEFWQVAFDMYQDIYGLPKGTYVLQVDAWVRMGGNDENYAAFTENNDTTMAFLYGVGDGATYSAPVANLMKGDLTEDMGYAGTEVANLGGVDYYLPNSLVGGKSVIEGANGAYTNSVVVKVGDDGILRIGIKKDEEKTNSWVVLDDFKLIYHGTNSGLVPGDNPSGVENVINVPAKKVEYYSLDGRRLNGAMKGITIQKTTLANGVIVVKKIRK